MGVRQEWANNFHAAAQFLVQFAVKSGLRGFALLDFATGEFPFSAQVFVCRALSHEHMAVALDQGADNGEGRGGR